jgi:hypothetical protein
MWDDLDDMFVEANSTMITALEAYPDHHRFLVDWYSQAQEHWIIFDANNSAMCLGWILDTASWQEIAGLFSQGRDSISLLEDQGKTREAVISKGDLVRAEDAWCKHDLDLTQSSLEKIISRVPEPAMVFILSLLIPIRLHRKTVSRKPSR